MTLASVKVDDLVLVSKRGREFLAVVIGRADGRLRFQPVDRRVSYQQATAREVVGHWRKAANSRMPQTGAKTAGSANDGG
jgi:hypothetical protein